MADEVKFTIDGIELTVLAGTLIVDAAKRAGLDIPVFCYHPKMAPVGMCRMCLVDVGRRVMDRATGAPELDAEGKPKIMFGRTLETGCTVRVEEGMVVKHTALHVEAARHDILEFLLTSHPLDCPVCDKGGECPLQNLTMTHGPGESRFILDDKIRLAKHIPLGELIYLDRERCIQCARCTRFQAEIVDEPVIGFYNRGRALEIQTHSDPGFDSYWSGNTTDICPVGALTTADFRFGARPWELNQAASICTQCAVGCNITFNTRREAKSGGGFRIKRVMPRQNEGVNEIWICDKGRFSTYQYTESSERLAEPLIRKDGELVPATWGEALDLVAGKFLENGPQLTTLASGRLSTEDLFNLQQLTHHLGGRAVLDSYMAGGDLVARYGLTGDADLGALGAGDMVVVAACDLEEEAPVWWLRVKQATERGANLVVINIHATRLDRYAAEAIHPRHGDVARTLGKVEVGEVGKLVILYGSDGLDLAGSQEVAEAAAELLTSAGHGEQAGSGLIATWQRPNDQGAWELGYRPAADLAGTLANAGALYLAGTDPVGDDPALAGAIEQVGFVVVQDLFLTPTAALADVVLPAAAFTGREGSLVSGERRAQRYYLAVPDLPNTRPDFTIASQVASRVDLTLEGRLAARVFQQIANAHPAFAGLSYIALAQAKEQWPIVGHGDMYYGGTTYENKQGLGVRLARAASQAPATDATTNEGDQAIAVEDATTQAIPSKDATTQGGDQAIAVEDVTTNVGDQAIAAEYPPTYEENQAIAAEESTTQAIASLDATTHVGDQAIAVEDATTNEGDQEITVQDATTYTAVPITTLYDRGQLIARSRVLRPRLYQPYLLAHPDDAGKFGLEEGELAELALGDHTFVVLVCLDDSLPQGIIGVPRSMGIPGLAANQNGPMAVKITRATETQAQVG